MENNFNANEFRFLESQNSLEKSHPPHNSLCTNDFDEQFYWVNQHMRHLWTHSNTPISASATTSATDTPYGTFQHSFHPLNGTISDNSITKNPVSPHFNPLPPGTGILENLPSSEPRPLPSIASAHHANGHPLSTSISAVDSLTYSDDPSFAPKNLPVPTEHSNHHSMFSCPPPANNIIGERLESGNPVPQYDQHLDQSLLQDSAPLYRVCSAPDPPTVSRPSVRCLSIENQSSSTADTSPDFSSLKAPSAISGLGAFEKVKEKLGEVKKKRQQTKHACAKCQRDNKKCDESRPCVRCRKTQCEDQCIDIPRKKRPLGMKRGPYKKGGSSMASTRRSDQENYSLAQKKKTTRVDDTLESLTIKSSQTNPSNNESSQTNVLQDVPLLDPAEETAWRKSRVRSYTNPIGTAENLHFQLPENLPLYPKNSPSVAESDSSKIHPVHPKLPMPTDFSAYSMHSFPDQSVDSTIGRTDEYVTHPWSVHDPSVVPPHIAPHIGYEHPPEVKMEDGSASVTDGPQTGNDPLHPSYHMGYEIRHIPEAEQYPSTHPMFDGMSHLEHTVSNDSSYSPHDTNFASPLKMEGQNALPETHYPFLRGRIHSFSIAADSPHHLVERPCLHCLAVADNPNEHANLADLRERQQRELEFTSMLLFHDHPSYHARPDLNFHEVLHPEHFAYPNIHHDNSDNYDYLHPH
ncbi:transcription factor [Schizosaccharomyces cryophilus OY26]|uniref:Transcription factor n=1 Tax=Schizosaccharomyces cryophilus (strain OY26 / ATCC MYA-4695 / CBS 11777 / NBRC 106824 / NRRL Y48691) TaxID=653667 RepID=S9WX19_SCHCR|nr:transcription factor [Schizosaccharomyces cryophilus OY26]EPY49282.1 transcription factor [Schizosaccharomyces cryophilus OY26]